MFQRCAAPRRKSKWKNTIITYHKYMGQVGSNRTRTQVLHKPLICIHGHKCNHANQNREASGEPNFETTAQSGGRQVHFPVTDMRNLRAASPDPSPDSDPRIRGKRLRHPEFHHSMRAPRWNSPRAKSVRQNGATKRRHVERHVPRVRPSQLPPRRRRFVRANAPRWRFPQLLHVPHGSEVLCHCERCERRTTGSLRCSQTRL